jgi:hypothetical protein
MSISAERRKHSRVTVDWPVLILNHTGGSLGEVSNISVRGALICFQRPLSPKEKYRLFIMVPDHKPLSLRAEVSWLDVSCSAKTIFPCSHGIRFTRVARVEREVLESAISSHD